MNRISLVISDVDGTLVAPDKRLTDASVQAVKSLRQHGIAFSIVSSRPPMGMRMLVEPLSLALPIGAFSGGAIVGPGLDVIEQHVIPELAARRSIEVMQRFGADVWLYTSDNWLVLNENGDYVPREKRTIEADPVIIVDFALFGESLQDRRLQQGFSPARRMRGRGARSGYRAGVGRPLAGILSRCDATERR
jgi:hydroxymethylpyrimidine pyrophosphatase-like HAD family hydrolase